MLGCEIMAKSKFILFLLAFFVLTGSVHAQDFDFHYFQQLPVVQDGRVKPIGHAAQLTLQKISGDKVSLAQADQWLAGILFDPIGAETQKIFRIHEKNLLHVLKLNDADQPFDFLQLNAAFIEQADLILSLRQTDPKDLSQDQQDLLDLYAQVSYFEQLKGSMTLLLPLKAEEGQTPQRFTDLYFNNENKKIVSILLPEGKNNQSFRVIPDTKTNAILWLTPWQSFLSNKSSSQILDLWSELAKAYITQDTAAWYDISKQLYKATLVQAKDPTLSFRLKTELAYLKFQPYKVSLALYLVGLICLLLFKRPLGMAILAAGLAAHGIGLLCRMIILQRPPVSDLYESILFVGAILMAGSLVYAWKKKDSVILIAGTCLAIILHVVGLAMSDESIDTLKVLQAVLDTKFWLSTHVIIITTGYAFCLMTAMFAHYCLYIFPISKKIFSRLHALALISLVFICTGTLLGGIWADQSWGRFWGWDPKENGALLIAVWLIWLVHGRISRQISDFYFVLGLAALSLIVSLSWIGINLLGVGLHSYGFMQGSINSLLILFGIEIAFFAFCIGKKRHG
jgi:ABC-type transport system involved in cytochrome c biogenesis permease subunit